MLPPEKLGLDKRHLSGQAACPQPAFPAVLGEERDWECVRWHSAPEKWQWGMQGSRAEGPMTAKVS